MRRISSGSGSSFKSGSRSPRLVVDHELRQLREETNEIQSTSIVALTDLLLRLPEPEVSGDCRSDMVVGPPSHSISARRREAIPRAAEHWSPPAMLTPPDSPHRPGRPSPHVVYESALNHTHPIRPRRRTVGPSTVGAALLRPCSTRWSNITSRPSSHRPPRWIPWDSASPHGLSATSGTTLRAVPPALWHSRSWIRTSPVCPLWLRLSGGVLLPEPGSMSVV